MCCETDRDIQGYRKKAYIIHFYFARAFRPFFAFFDIFMFSLCLFFTLREVFVWLVRMFCLHTGLFCAILQALLIVF